MSVTRVFETVQSTIAFHAIAIVDVDFDDAGVASTNAYVLTVEREPRYVVRRRRIRLADLPENRTETAFDLAINDAQAAFEFEIVYPFLHQLQLTHLLPAVTFSKAERGRLITVAVMEKGRDWLREIQARFMTPSSHAISVSSCPWPSRRPVRALL